jgi:hypothetical protein
MTKIASNAVTNTSKIVVTPTDVNFLGYHIGYLYLVELLNPQNRAIDLVPK